jgi:phage tail sheath protein FI
MPEYLSPGVYVEEVSFRSKSIEGVPTSTTGMVGMAHYGPTYYPGGPLAIEPRLVTSYTEFERIYGGIDRLTLAGNTRRECYLGHAVRAFFANGGKRVYISRAFSPVSAVDNGCAARTITVTGAFTATWRARWPGAMGNVHVQTVVRRSKNLAVDSADVYPADDPRHGWGIQATRVRAGSVVEIIPSGGAIPLGNTDLTIGNLAVVELDSEGRQTFRGDGADVAVSAGDNIALIELQVQVKVTPDRLDVYDELTTGPDQTRYIGRILQLEDPEDENAVVWLDWDPADDGATVEELRFMPAQLAVALQQSTTPRLAGGGDGQLPMVEDATQRNTFNGMEADPDHAERRATGLYALDEIDDIAIVAMPDGAALGSDERHFVAMQRLIQHCEQMRYRIAVVDGPANASMNEIREFRGKFDSKYAALYHPWIEILDPNERPAQGAPQRRLLLPPSGFVTGIYARSDIERGVHKAPANEVVRGLTRFEVNINKGRQDVLNPEGINALRFFEGRGNRVWGARTMSSDPEWKYVNVRRLFIYVEHSIDKGSQWAVFEPNGPRLWGNVRQMIEDFLLVMWRDGWLLGDKPEQAYFVRCDRTTMTQNDLDNGRMICLVGIAPVKPAEFVIFRIGQWTADAKV